MNWIDYRERLEIGFDDSRKFSMCKNRMNNLMIDLAHYYTEDSLYLYMNTIGEDFRLYDRVIPPLNYAMFSVSKAKTLKEFISKYVALINSAKGTLVTDDGESFSELLETAITDTLETYRIPYEIMHDNDGVFIFPKGIPEFDKELISDSLIWLIRYPETEKAWRNALKAYSDGEEPSEVADKFRKTLERFFQNFFVSGQTLENIKPEYGRYLKSHGIPGEITANLECLVQQYSSFMNNYAKHHDKTSHLLLEYIMYQTGNTIRLLINLADEDEKNQSKE